MNITWLSTGFGTLLTLAWLFIWRSRISAWQEFRQQVFAEGRVVAKRKRSVRSYAGMLRREAAAMGTPEQSSLWVRSVLLVVALVLASALLLRLWFLLFLIPAAFAAPLLYARVAARAHQRKLAKQTRVVEMLLAFLLRAGATLSDTLLMLERRIDPPMRDKLCEVNAQKRYTTLPGALEALGDSTGVPQLRELAALVSESERNGTPIADAILRSIRLDMKTRDANAAQRYGQVQLEVAMYATLLIAMPGFGFAIYAMLAFALHLFGSWSFG
ncbi:MAG: type II secretion system F family protein [Bacilli bacterium]